MPENQNTAEGGAVAAKTEPVPSQQVNGSLTPEQIAQIVSGVVAEQMKPLTESIAETNKRVSSMKKSTRAELAKVRQQRKAVKTDVDADEDEFDDELEEGHAQLSWSEALQTRNEVMRAVSKDQLCGHMLNDPMLARETEGLVVDAISRGMSPEDAQRMAMGMLYPKAMELASRQAQVVPASITPPKTVPAAEAANEQNPAIPAVVGGASAPVSGNGKIDPIPAHNRAYFAAMGLDVPAPTK